MKMANDNPDTKSMCQKVARSLEETNALARDILPLMLRSGVVSLEGPLGSGKTHFVKATAQAMGIVQAVTSPTFTLLQSYESGKVRLYHSDWYRLESEEEVLALSLEEYYGDGLILIEWGEKFSNLLSPETLIIRIETMPDESRLFRWELKKNILP